MSSGLAIHEREREEERRRRAKLARQPSNTGDIPLFEEPRRVQPSTQDALQQRIQATLGKFDTIAPSVFQNQNHLFGIPISRLPQTPVDGENKFNFDTKSKDYKKVCELKKAKAPNMISNYQETSKRTLNSSNVKVKEEVNGTKNHKASGLLNGSGHGAAKSSLVIKSQDSAASSKNSSLSNLKSPPVAEKNSSKVDSKKLEIKPAVNGALKLHSKDVKLEENSKAKVKVEKDGKAKSESESENRESSKGQMLKSNATSKSKPPKIKLPDRSLPTASEEQENHSVNEPANVEKIIAEMQQVAPPLTGIHTPNKAGNSVFAFGHRNITHESSVPLIGTSKRKLSESTEVKKENGNGEVLLTDDLMLTDESDDEHERQPSSASKTNMMSRHRSHSTSSSGSSSDDSDSDSSDSDSDSSGSDTNNNTKDKKSIKSPLKSPSSSPKPASGRNWDLNHFVKALNQPSTPPATKTKPSPSSANTVGEDGIRGNQIAPAANSNKSSLNSHFSGHTSAASKQIKSPVAPVPDSLGFAAELLSNSPELDQGIDIESLTAKLDLPHEAEATETPNEPVSNDPGLTVKIPLPKASKKGDKKSSGPGTKQNSSQEKNQINKTPSPKKQVKISGKETKTPKNSASTIVSNGIDKNKVSKTAKGGKAATGIKSSTKKKAETKNSVTPVPKQELAVPKQELKSNCEADEEDVIIDILGVENSPVKTDSKPASAAKSKETEKPKKSKSKPVNVNGVHKPVNGVSTLISPSRTKDILGKNVVIAYDDVNKPESLIVKIDLSLLKRIPRLPGNELIKQEPTLSPVEETNGIKDAIHSPEVKIPKRKSFDATTERDTLKKMKSESEADSSHTKSHERSFSNSSLNSSHNKGSHRKRSPSHEEDSYRIKRQRHDSESNKMPGNFMESHQNGTLSENGVDVTDSGLKPQECSCNGRSNIDKREADIARLYDPEPRVPYGPDHYLAEAKRLKHRADSMSDKEVKAFFYIDAVMFFARCGKAIEQNEEESRSAFQMYSETLDLLRYTMRNFVNRYTHRSHNVPDKRLSALCMRIQSILYMRLYKLRKDSIMRNIKMVTEHFRGPPKSTQAPSPYTSNTKITGTPSPLSPTPSPSGSVGSVGSNGSNETMTTPSRNGKPSSTSSAMTSPVNVCIPQKIHAMTQQHVLTANNLLYSQDTWDQSQPIVLEFRDFFMDLDRTCGPLTLHSPVVHMIEYIEEGVRRTREAHKAIKS